MANTSNSVWNSIKRLLVVVKFDRVETIHDWREAIKLSGLNIHDCIVLGIVASKKERLALDEMSSVVYISEKDFGLLNRLKNEEAQRVFNDRFDTLLVVGEIPKKINKALLKLTVRMDVSLNTSEEQRTINLTTEESTPKYMLNFVKQTLEKIT